MKRAAASRTTLFVLTTREYILQQAHELYERLAIEGVEGRRFLLELRLYSRTDRARIFYNHASFSDGLTLQAKKALLAGRAYEAIIDHPMYNPRHIEWITGLSARPLTAENNADYVAYAVDALSHPDPERIWQHGFEHQLNDAQRALLLVLVTMPDRVEHDDLERAFEAFADLAGFSARGHAFTRALRVLDDSFVHTYQDENHTFVETYDPSVADFLAGYVRSSPDDSRLLIQGAACFEQVESLARVLPAQELQGSPASEYLDAVERCLDEPSCTWHDVHIGRDATEPTTIRWHAAPEGRVNFIGRVKTWRGAYREEALRSRLRSAYAEAKERVRRDWEEDRGQPEEAIALLRGMRRRGEGIQTYAPAAKKLITQRLSYSYAFSHLLDLRALAPSIFDDSEWSELRDEYLTVAGEELMNWDDIRSLDEIDELERYAEGMGVQLDSHEVREVRERVEEAIAEAEDRATQDQEDRQPETPEPDGGDAEIEALFTRLANP